MDPGMSSMASLSSGKSSRASALRLLPRFGRLGFYQIQEPCVASWSDGQSDLVLYAVA